MLRRPFLVFMLVIGLLIVGAVAFIQSTHFAGVVKRVVAKYVPTDMGVAGDFSELAVKLFPPGISVRNPKISLKKGNILKLPPGSELSAERLDLTFLPFQMFSGNIRVHQVAVINGDIRLLFDRPAPKKTAKKGISFRWDDLLQVRAEAVSLQNTRVRLKFSDPSISAELIADSVYLGQWPGSGGVGYEGNFKLRDIECAFPNASYRFSTVSAQANVNEKGIEIKEFSAAMEGLTALASGLVKGDVLNPKGLSLETRVKLQGELGEIASRILGKSSMGVKGEALLEAKVGGALDRLMESLRAEGTLTLKDAKFKQWSAEHVSVEGAWVASSAGGEVSVQKLSISSAEKNRIGGSQSAGGGRVEAGPFKVALGAIGQISVPILLDRAHIHWLAAPGLKDVYGMDFRLSGPLQVTYVPTQGEQPWYLDADMDFNIPGFQLDNQRLGTTKPLHRVLNVQVLRLVGGVRVDARAIRPRDLALILPHTHLQVTGRMDFKNGYDLLATGQLDLSDFGTIAENQIRGTGPFSAHIHGKSERTYIDFDTELSDAYYLRLRLGTLKGRITWDDDPQHLIFSNVSLLKGRTSYFVDGKLELGSENAADLQARIEQGDIQDFIQIFDEFTQGIGWFPNSLRGDMGGSVTIQGGLALSRIDISAAIEGRNWDFHGEKFKSVTLLGGYDRGKYHVRSAKAVKRSSALAGRISYDANSTLDWEFRASELSMNELDLVARLDVPVRGKLTIASTGKGKEGAIESETRIWLRDPAIRGAPVLPSEIALKSSAGVAHATATVQGGQGRLDLLYDFKPNAESYLKASMKQLDFTPVLLLLNPRTIQDRSLAGIISAEVNLSFRSGQVDRGIGEISLSEYVLAKSGTRFHLVEPVSVKLDRGNFDLSELVIRGERGRTKIEMKGRDTRLDGSVTGDVDVSIVEFLTSSIYQSMGTAALDLRIGGEMKAPQIYGRAVLKSASVRVPSVESPFENISGTFQLRQNALLVQNLEADLANGRVITNGSILFFVDRYPKISINTALTGNKLRVYPFQVAKVKGTLHVHGDELPYSVDGDIEVESALSREKMFGQTPTVSFKSAKYMPPPTLRRESDYPKFRLNIKAKAEKGVVVQNELFDAELRGEITIVNTLETPRLLGNAQVIQGKMSFKDRVFQIQSADIRFDNPAVINPAFNLNAHTDVNNTKIQMYASGRLDSIKVELSSDPTLPESEILNLLALGLTSEEIKRLRAGDSGALEQSASVLLNTMDFNRDLQKKTGFQFQLDEADSTSHVGTSIFTQRTDSASGTTPKIVIKPPRIIDNVDLSVGSTVGLGSATQSEVNAEVHLAPGLSVIGVWDSVEGVDAQESRKSYGVDLKFQKRFK